MKLLILQPSAWLVWKINRCLSKEDFVVCLSGLSQRELAEGGGWNRMHSKCKWRHPTRQGPDWALAPSLFLLPVPPTCPTHMWACLHSRDLLPSPRPLTTPSHSPRPITLPGWTDPSSLQLLLVRAFGGSYYLWWCAEKISPKPFVRHFANVRCYCCSTAILRVGIKICSYVL